MSRRKIKNLFKRKQRRQLWRQGKVKKDWLKYTDEKAKKRNKNEEETKEEKEQK